LLSDHTARPLKIRSVVGWLPLVAVELIDRKVMERLPGFAKRARWFIAHRRDLSGSISWLETNEPLHDYFLLALPTKERLRRSLGYLFDEQEFLAPHGLRSLSKWHGQNPYVLSCDGATASVGYEPGAAETPLFGGNSNWRGPIWFPVNYLFIEALERYDRFYGPSFKVEYPTRSGRYLTLAEIAHDLSGRLASLFLRDASGRRPSDRPGRQQDEDPHGRDLVQFHEYFHGDTGQGLGASHQTGWTALVVRFFAETMRHRSRPKSSAPASRH
jgi:hypothetical protein